MTSKKSPKTASPNANLVDARSELPDFPPARPFRTHRLGLTDFIGYHEQLLKQRTDIHAMTNMTKSEAAFYTAVYLTAQAECEYNDTLWSVRDATADLNLLAAVERRKQADTKLVESAHELLHRAKKLETATRMEEVIELCNRLVGDPHGSDTRCGRQRRSQRVEILTEADSDSS